MLLGYFNDIVFDEREQKITLMGEVYQTFSDEAIRQLGLRSVFIGCACLMLLVIFSLMTNNTKHSFKLYLLIVGVVLLVSTLLFTITLVNISNIIEVRGL
jgi:preprotein translocase subunit SecF